MAEWILKHGWLVARDKESVVESISGRWERKGEHALRRRSVFQYRLGLLDNTRRVFS